MRSNRIYAGVFSLLLFTADASLAQDSLKVAVGSRGVGETFVPELGQNAGIFKKHGLTLDIL